MITAIHTLSLIMPIHKTLLKTFYGRVSGIQAGLLPSPIAESAIIRI
jgi:hypothetical protein